MRNTKQAVSLSDRPDIFISHATPEDNDFTIWLGAKLEALGFRVWADVLRLRGGQDWQRLLERALRQTSRKVLFVGTPRSAEKQGPRNELEIASQVAREIGDDNFIIPLRVMPHPSIFRIAQAQYIDFFTSGWAHGLTELLERFNELGIVGSHNRRESSLWQELQMLHRRALVAAPELLVSNWLCLAEPPPRIAFYDFSGGISIDHADARCEQAPWPLVRYHHGFLSFADAADLYEHFGPRLPFSKVADMSTDVFLEDGWWDSNVRLKRRDAQSFTTQMWLTGIQHLANARGLRGFEMAGGVQAWWLPLSPDFVNQVSFDFEGLRGSRQLQGYSAVREVYWHYAASFSVRFAPYTHIEVSSHVLFTGDGAEPIPESSRQHRLRRSFTKSWRNARWRDLMLAYLHILSAGQRTIRIPLGASTHVDFILPPIMFESQMQVNEEHDSSTGGYGDEFDELDEDGSFDWENEDEVDSDA